MVLYENAPMSFAVSLATLLVTTFGPHRSALDIVKIGKGDFGRIFSSQFAFDSTTETIVALILIYSCRLFESQMGSRKFGAFVIFSWILSVLIQLLLLKLFQVIGLYLIPSPGPYFLVFAQLAFFYRYIPKVYMTQYVFMGIEFSEKSGIYLLALQLFFSNGIKTIFPSLVGLLVGYLYARNTFKVQKLLLPSFFEKFFRLVNALVGTLFPFTNRPQPRQPQGRANNLNNFPTNQQYQQQPPQQQYQPAFELPPPDEESIQTLMNLGFEREAVLLALRHSGNNVDAAANRLLR
eukprot:gene1368-1449_t